MFSYLRPLRREEKPCRYYQRPGGCRYGSECKYRHIERARSRSRSRCRYGGACRLLCRNACRYFHGRAETANEINVDPFNADSQMQDRLSVQPRPAVTAPEQPLQARPAVPGPIYDEPEAEPEDEEVQTGPPVVPPVATLVDQPVQPSPEREVCVVCYVGRVEVAYSKCGHMCICKACSGIDLTDGSAQRMSLRKCPICRRTSPKIIIFPTGVPAGQLRHL